MKRLTIRDESGFYHLRRGPKGGEINKITVVQHLGRLEDIALQPTLTPPSMGMEWNTLPLCWNLSDLTETGCDTGTQ